MDILPDTPQPAWQIQPPAVEFKAAKLPNEEQAISTGLQTTLKEKVETAEIDTLARTILKQAASLAQGGAASRIPVGQHSFIELKQISGEEERGRGEFGLVQKCQVAVVATFKEISETAHTLEFARKVPTEEQGSKESIAHELTIYQGLQSSGVELNHVVHAHVVNNEGLLLEHMEKTLATQIQESPPTGDGAKKVLLDIMRGIGEMHNAGYVHGDITADNCMLTKDDTGKLCDMGCAQKHGELNQRPVNYTISSSKQISALAYNAPFKRDKAEDVFAMGVLLYQLVHGAPPQFIQQLQFFHEKLGKRDQLLQEIFKLESAEKEKILTWDGKDPEQQSDLAKKYHQVQADLHAAYKWYEHEFKNFPPNSANPLAQLAVDMMKNSSMTIEEAQARLEGIDSSTLSLQMPIPLMYSYTPLPSHAGKEASPISIDIQGASTKSYTEFTQMVKQLQREGVNTKYWRDENGRTLPELRAAANQSLPLEKRIKLAQVPEETAKLLLQLDKQDPSTLSIKDLRLAIRLVGESKDPLAQDLLVPIVMRYAEANKGKGQIAAIRTHHLFEDLAAAMTQKGNIQGSAHLLSHLPMNESGNKAAKLIELSAIPGVAVPPFFSITHTEVQQHLLKYYPAYEEDWQRFVQAKGTQFAVPPEAEAVLKEIQENIERAFTEHPFVMDIPPELGTKGANRLMVRSSGAEDTAEMANAGGNYSEAGVEVSQEAISKAMGRVVASYHSPLSMTQRSLAAQDITNRPITPVLVQVMIGESADSTPQPNEVPISGIAYSREILGKTDTLTQIQALPGHNEAAVNSLLPVDTFYAYPDGTRHEVVRPKYDRLVADGKGGFITRKNDESMHARPALTPELIGRLEKITRAIHDEFDQPMDIEWVYDPVKDEIFIVQARPLVEKHPLHPETINAATLREVCQDVQEHHSETIVSIGAKVAVIDNPAQLIADTTLEKAFHRFWKLAQRQEHGAIRAVVVKEPAAATSHYACTLREMGVHVFYSPTFDREALTQAGSFIAIDPQKDVLFSGRNLPPDQRSNLVKSGWVRHPMAAVETVQQVQPSTQEEAGRLAALIGLDAEKAAAVGALDTADLKLLLDNLGSTSQEEAAESARELIQWVAVKTNSIVNSNLEAAQKERAIQLLRNAVRIGSRVLESHLPQMQRLHAAKRLQALLLQEVTAGVVNSDSLIQVIRLRQIMDSVTLPKWNLLTPEEQTRLKAAEAKEQGPQSPLTTQEMQTALAIYEVVGQGAISSQSQLLWMDLCNRVVSSQSRYANRLLLKVIDTYQKLNVTDTWLNLHVAPHLAKNEGYNAIEILEMFVSELDKSAPMLSGLEEKHQLIQKWNSLEGQWADPSNFDKLFAEFDQFDSMLREVSLFMKQIDPNDTIARSAYMQLLKEGIDTYDRAIKSVRGSPFYTDKSLQSKRFLQMLQGYVQLSIYWAKQIPGETRDSWTRTMRAAAEGRMLPDPVEHYVQESQKQMKMLSRSYLDASQLRPSAKFNVALQTLSSAQLSSLHSLHDCTLEDLFTLAHQNMLASFDTVFRPPWERELPDDLVRVNQTILTNIQKEFDYGFKIPFKANLLSCTPTRKSIELVYNVPLKNHSSLIKVTYDRATGKSSVTVDILGHNLGNRMGSTLDLATIAGLVSMGKVLKTTGYDKATERLSFTWDFSREDLQPEDLEKLTAIIIAAYEMTLTGMFGGGDIQWEKIDGGKPEFYKSFLASPEHFANMCAIGMDNKIVRNELSKFFNRLNELGMADQLCSMFGLKLENREGHLSDKLGNAFCSMLFNESELPPLLKNSTIRQTILGLELKYLFNMATPDSTKKLLLAHKEKLTLPVPAAKEYSVAIGKMRHLALAQMISSSEFSEEDVEKYILSFGTEGQKVSWETVLDDLNTLSRYYPPKEKSDQIKLERAFAALRRITA